MAAPVARNTVVPLAAAIMLLAVSAAWLPAQVVLGIVKDSVTGSAVVGATISVLDSTSVIVAETQSDDNGTFRIDANRVPKMRFLVRKIGVQPSRSGLFDIPSDADTLSVELLVPVNGVTLATVRVVASVLKPNFNTMQLKEARQSGWRIIEPYRIAADRQNVAQFSDLIRRYPIGGVRLPRNDGECFTSSRSNRCLTIVVDGQVLGPNAFIAPGDVHFIAFLSAVQSQVQYGDRAPQGAIFVATRRRGDDERKPASGRPDRDEQPSFGFYP